MRNIIQIFLRGIRKIKEIPCHDLSWWVFWWCPRCMPGSIFGGSWDPYENTSDIKIAVASDDAGYQGELLPLDINLGDRVLTYFHENDEMDWVFTDSEEADRGNQVREILRGHRSAGKLQRGYDDAVLGE